MATFDVLNRQNLTLQNARNSLWSALYVGLIALFALWGVVQLFIRPEPLLLAFVLDQFFQFLFSFSLLGFTRLFFSGQLVDRPIKTITNNPFGLSLSKANIGRQ